MIQKCLHTQRDQLTDTVSGIDITHLHIRQLLYLRILHDGLSGGKQPPGIGISLALRQLLAHITDHLVRCAETKGSRIADIEL